MNLSDRNRVRLPREARETHEVAQRRLVMQTRSLEQPRADVAWGRYFEVLGGHVPDDSPLPWDEEDQRLVAW
jgi:hypothetical protein